MTYLNERRARIYGEVGFAPHRIEVGIFAIQQSYSNPREFVITPRIPQISLFLQGTPLFCRMFDTYGEKLLILMSSFKHEAISEQGVAEISRVVVMEYRMWLDQDMAFYTLSGAVKSKFNLTMSELN